MFRTPALSISILVILLCLPGAAAAYEWAVQINGPQLSLFQPYGEELSDLLDDSPMVGSSFGLDFDLYKGLTVGFDFAGLYGYRGYRRHKDDFDEPTFASAEVAASQFGVGVRYGRRLFKFWTPWASIDFVPSVWRVTVSDDYINSANEGGGMSGRGTVGFDFFPLTWSPNKYLGGLGLSASLFLDSGEVKDLGTIDDVSGFGLAFGLVYRFPTFGAKAEAWEESPPYEPQPEDQGLVEEDQDKEPLTGDQAEPADEGKPEGQDTSDQGDDEGDQQGQPSN